LTRQELKLDVKRTKYRKIFDFWLLHYLLIESHKEKHEDRLIESHKEKHEDRLIESHDEKHREKMKKNMKRNIKKNMKKKHEDRLTLIESHDEDTW